MVLELENIREILPLLYDDCISYVEEISLIEEDYLWQNVSVYVDNTSSMQQFLILHSPSFFWGGQSLSAYMKADNPSTISRFEKIIMQQRKNKVHLQTSAEAATSVRRYIGWLDKTYTVRYHRVDMHTFKPACKHREKAILLTPNNVKNYIPSASSHYIKRLETAEVYGYLNEEGKIVATSGVGYLTKKSFAISYTGTEPEYRRRGIAKCLTSLASESLIKKGLVGVYGADVTNNASVGVAEGIGFVPYRDMMCFYRD